MHREMRDSSVPQNSEDWHIEEDWCPKVVGGGLDSPNDVDQNHQLDQTENDSHFLVSYQHHPGSVILKEEG